MLMSDVRSTVSCGAHLPPIDQRSFDDDFGAAEIDRASRPFMPCDIGRMNLLGCSFIWGALLTTGWWENPHACSAGRESDRGCRGSCADSSRIRTAGVCEESAADANAPSHAA